MRSRCTCHSSGGQTHQHEPGITAVTRVYQVLTDVFPATLLIVLLIDYWYTRTNKLIIQPTYCRNRLRNVRCIPGTCLLLLTAVYGMRGIVHNRIILHSAQGSLERALQYS